ncbi:hypothetical protein [uncultured Desulfovibrio sp.]|nr:hypothetical protein [uncultured Desulfovibrio sp.]
MPALVLHSLDGLGGPERLLVTAGGALLRLVNEVPGDFRGLVAPAAHPVPEQTVEHLLQHARGGSVLREIWNDPGLVLAVGGPQPPDRGTLHLVDEFAQTALVGGANPGIGVDGTEEFSHALPSVHLTLPGFGLSFE